jgi:hypothetical protein
MYHWLTLIIAESLNISGATDALNKLQTYAANANNSDNFLGYLDTTSLWFGWDFARL